jgi:hypothetical protein
MRSLRLLSPLWFFFASVVALAQPGADPPSPVIPRALLPNTAPESGQASEDEIRTKSAYWHDECIRDWDRQTHMTKKEWADTCQRVVDDRVKWLRSRDHLEDLYGP